MRLRRLRTGELLAGAGAVALVVTLFLDWFDGSRGARVTGDAGTSGWSSLGWPVVALIVVTVALAVWLVVATVSDASVGQPVMAGVLLSTMAPLTLVVALVRVTVAQPGHDEAVAVEPAAYAGLVALALVVAGAWRAIADERTDAPESVYTPPPPRPAPPERI